MSFGVVKTPSARSTALFSWTMRFQKGYSSPIPLLKQQNSTSHGVPYGSLAQKSLLRNSICCQRGRQDYSETRFAASANSGETMNGPLTAPPGPVFVTGAGSGFGTTCTSLPRLVAAIGPRFPIDRLGCLVIPPCSLRQSVTILRTKALQCLSTSPGKLSRSFYTGVGRGAAHRGDVTYLCLRAAPSEVDA